MIFTKEDVSASDEQVENLTREYNIHYLACIGSLIYLLSTRVDLRFAVHKLAKFSANPVTDLLRQTNIKTKNHLMAFSYSSWQDCPDTGRSTGLYIILYQGGPIYHRTYVSGPSFIFLNVSQQMYQPLKVYPTRIC